MLGQALGLPYCNYCTSYYCSHSLLGYNDMYLQAQTQQLQQARAFTFPPDVKKPNKILLLLR